MNQIARCLLVIIWVCLVPCIYAQNTGYIKGQLLDNQTKEVLPYASARLLNKADSSFVMGSVTDDTGFFSLNAAYGQYILSLEYIGYKTVQQELSVDSALKDLGSISLEIDANQIKQVEVVGQKSETTYHLDKKVFTVGSDLTAVGTNAIDILNDVPSVATDIDGNVSLRGNAGVQILINGKQSGLTGLGTTNALKNIPADLIDRIEVITNPSARYDAQGQVGIINIVLKKQRKAGFNAAIDAAMGYPKQASTAVNLNYRKNAVNLFTNLGVRSNVRPGQGFANYQYFQPQGDITLTTNNRDFERKGLSYNGQFGLEYFMGERQSLTGSISYTIGDDKNETSTKYTNYNGNQLLDQRIRTDNETEDEEDLAYNLNYAFDIDKEKGKKLTADVRYDQTGETEGSDYFERTVLGTVQPDIKEKSLNKEQQGEYLFQVDFVNPLSKTQKLEFGAKSTLREIRTDFDVDREDEQGIYQPVAGLNNKFNYDEDIYALYGIYANEINKFSYQVGLRGEYTDIKTELKETDEVNARDYLNLFPSVFLNYKTKGGNAFQLSYSRRFQRPGFWYLNPFLTYSDARRRFTGNPNLNPEFSNQVELGVLKEWSTSTLNSSVYYRHSTDVIERIVQPLEADTVQIIPVNLNSSDNAGFEFIFNSDIKKWLTIDYNANIYYFKENGANIGSSFNANGWALRNRLTSRLNFDNGWNGQFRFDYRSPRNTTQGKRKAIYTMDAAVAKELFKGRGTLTFNVRDIANSRKRRSETITEEYISDSEFQWRSRSMNLGFNYRINQKKKRERSMDSGDGDGGGGF